MKSVVKCCEGGLGLHAKRKGAPLLRKIVREHTLLRVPTDSSNNFWGIGRYLPIFTSEEKERKKDAEEKEEKGGPLSQ